MKNILKELSVLDENYGACVGSDLWLETKDQGIIESINPSKLCFIAFDGVAPLAKLKQQRNRRYKSFFEKNISNKIHNTNKIKWNTCAITPGTPFMNNLNNTLRSLFQNRSNKIKIISRSPENKHN